jgi:hypothetical protein
MPVGATPHRHKKPPIVGGIAGEPVKSGQARRSDTAAVRAVDPVHIALHRIGAASLAIVVDQLKTPYARRFPHLRDCGCGRSTGCDCKQQARQFFVHFVSVRFHRD